MITNQRVLREWDSDSSDGDANRTTAAPRVDKDTAWSSSDDEPEIESVRSRVNPAFACDMDVRTVISEQSQQPLVPIRAIAQKSTLTLLAGGTKIPERVVISGSGTRPAAVPILASAPLRFRKDAASIDDEMSEASAQIVPFGCNPQFNNTLSYRSGYLRSVATDVLLRDESTTNAIKPVRVSLQSDLSCETERDDWFEVMEPKCVIFCVGSRQRRRRLAPDVHVSRDDDWVTGGDSPANDDVQPTRGFLRNRENLVRKPRVAVDEVNADAQTDPTDKTSSSDDDDSGRPAKTPTEYEESEKSEVRPDDLTDEQRERIYDEWQIHSGPRSCGVMLKIDRIANGKFNPAEKYSFEIYYKDSRRGKAPLDAATGIIDMEQYLSVEDDSVPIVFLVVRKKAFGRKADEGLAAVLLNNESVERTQGVTREGCYFEKGAAKIPIVDPLAQNVRLGGLIVSWHADMREATGTDFCPSCGRLRIFGPDGKELYCVCDAEKKRLHREREARDRKFKESALTDARDRRLAKARGQVAEPVMGTVVGDSWTIPTDTVTPQPAEIDEVVRIADPVKHKPCCVVM